MSAEIRVGDCLDVLRTLDADSVQTCVTSPPYFGLRDYGVAGQIGLESTPDAYVAKLVDVFREVRRVLRPDGTVWLNLGDSYSGGGKGGNPGSSPHLKQRTNEGSLSVRGVKRDGDKPKDLLGIPWRVAFALQQPYYAGSIKDERDRIWLAAMLDAEGCMFIHKRKAGTDSGAKYTRADGSAVSYARTADTFGPGVEIANTHLAVVERCSALYGKGTITRQEKDRRQPLYRWHLRGDEARQFVRELYPHLVAKQHQARVLCGCPSSGEKADAAHAALIRLHNAEETTVDFPAPASMFEPGFYLRSDIIWSKSNPMPESVTDRPTKAHEYLFLLAKAERYYYDAEAIKEPAISAGEARGGGIKISASNEHYPEGSAKQNLDRYGVTPIDRNRRTVWTVATQPYSGAHFATFPPALIEPCILAGSRKGDTVLDPFGGAGTTGLVADRLGRNALLIELNPTYAELARRRIVDDAPLFNAGEVA